MALSDIKTKEHLIKQWVLWAYEGRGLSLYFSPVTNFAKMRPRKANGLSIDPDEGAELDRVVGLLKLHNEAQYEAFTLYHLAGYPYREVAKAMGHNDHKRALHLVDLAEQFFELMTLGPQNRRDACAGATSKATLQAR